MRSWPLLRTEFSALCQEQRVLPCGKGDPSAMPGLNWKGAKEDVRPGEKAVSHQRS